jgi:hypothetical protein
MGWWLAMMLVAGQAWGESFPDGFGFETQFHYDWTGHHYWLGESDTLDLYDEKGLSAILTYGDRFRGGAWAENRATLSDRSLQNALVVGWSSVARDDIRWMFENRMEFKDYRWRGKDLYSSGYVEDDLAAEGNWPLLTDLRLATRQDLSYIDYQKTTSYFRDAWLSRTTAELQWEPGLLWDMTLAYTLGVKNVPDSSGMNYRTHTWTSSLDGCIGWTWRCQLTGLLERRQNREPEQRTNSFDLMMEAKLEYDISLQTSLVLQGNVEMLTYDHPDEVYYDNWTAVGKAGLSRDLSENMNIAVLPLLQRSMATGTTFGETYREIGAELDLDYHGTGKLWGQASVEIGFRNYDDSVEETFYSDYYSVRPTVMLNLRLSERFDLDLLLDHEPEWHRQKEDDFSSSLLSCSINYRLR